MSRFLTTMIVLLAIAALASPAIADEYKFSVYGSARMATFYSNVDPQNGGDTDTDFTTDLAGNSRFGMKASNGPISGQFEVGTGVNLRLLYGVYKFDGGNVLVGQTYNPYTFFSDQVYGADNGFIGYGALYDGRQPQIKLTLDNGFYFDVLKNTHQAVGNANLNTTIPKLAVGYNGKAGMFAYGVGVAYQGYEVKAGGSSTDYASYLGYFHGSVDLNPAAITFNLAYGQNAREFGLLGGPFGDGAVVADPNNDTTFMAGFVQAAFKANDMNKIAVGIGYASEDNDSYAQTETRMSYMLQDSITIAPGFYVVPEISYFDGMDEANGTDGTQALVAGAKWQINF